MAAAADRCAPEVAELSRLRVDEIETLLEDECLAWRSLLSWDFEPSAELVRRFVRIHALGGYALLFNGRVIGYSYYVAEDGKGLVGDLYVARGHDTSANSGLLLSAVLETLFRTPGIRRIEAQLMMVHGAFDRLRPFARYAQAFPRIFMLADIAEASSFAPSRAEQEYRFIEWEQTRQDEAAVAIASAYHGHVDGKINDQYRSWPGARRFLTNVIQYPGCGQFLPGASFMAFDREDRLAGIILCSLVASDTGHVTQVCVTPEARGKGLGYELMRRAMLTLREGGCERTSLTVTASNTTAIQLYSNIGFRAVRRFSAYVWEGF